MKAIDKKKPGEENGRGKYHGQKTRNKRRVDG
jgi:hypothetical protein